MPKKFTLSNGILKPSLLFRWISDDLRNDAGWIITFALLFGFQLFLVYLVLFY